MFDLSQRLALVQEAIETVRVFLGIVVPRILVSTAKFSVATLVPYEVLRAFILIASRWQEVQLSGIKVFLDTYIGEYSLEAWKTYVLLVFVVFVLYEPANEYSRVRKLAGKYDWMDVEFTQFQFPPESVYGKGLKIINHKDFDMSSFSARILTLRYLNKKGDFGFSDNIRYLGWVLAEDTLTRMPQNIARGGGELFLQIAQWNEKAVWLSTGEQLPPTEIGPISYRPPHSAEVKPGDRFFMEIEFVARIDDLALQTHLYKCNLIVNDGGVVEIIPNSAK